MKIAARAHAPLLWIALLLVLSWQLQAKQLVIPFVTFAPGDIFVSLETGPVQWRGADGTLRRILLPTIVGTGEGMAFDPAGNLYVTRWCIDGSCSMGNTVEKYNTYGLSVGAVGGTFNCQPHTMFFSGGSAYIGHAACSKTIRKSAGDSLTPIEEFGVATENHGVFWMDLGVDDCTVFYTSYGPNVKRYDICGRTQLPDLNQAPLPGGMAQDVRALPDGGVLVSSGDVVVRLDQSGAMVRTYSVPGEGALWAGIDLAGDGTFWVANYYSSNVHRFNLATGAHVGSFNAGTPANTVVAVRIKR